MKEQCKSLWAIIYPADEMRSPVTGQIGPFQEVSEEIFAQNILGGGLVFYLHANKGWAPISGTIASGFPNGHCIWCEGRQGITYLSQIGLKLDDRQDRKVNTQAHKRGQVEYGNELAPSIHDRTQALSGVGLVIQVDISGLRKNKYIFVAPDGVTGGRDEILRMSG